MKTHLSHILPVADACSLLGEVTVRRIVKSIMQFRQSMVHNPRNPQIPGSTIATDPQEELAYVRALFHPVPPLEDVASQLPADIAEAWQKLTKRNGPLSLDKALFLRWAVPSCSAPYAGHGGHLGLFDCLTYALQASPQPQQQAVGMTPIVLLPDLIIFFAICRGRTSVQKDHGKDSYGAMLLSVMAFRIYDSYQKRGTVTRDTLHKFMSDVYGEESYKTPQVRKMLDALYTIPEPEDDAAKIAAGSVIGRVVASLSAAQFCKGISETLTDGSTSHILLDWIATLGNAMLPSRDIPQSTQAYLETISSSNRSTARLCHEYGLAEGRLYEIKRRFHSMVESSNVLIHGDGQLPMTEQEGEGSSTAPAVGDRPRHVITKDAFVKALSSPNDELGHGGYLPEELAELVFEGGCPPRDPDTDIASSYWAMYDVLSFGCQAVRTEVDKKSSVVTADKSNESSLLRFVFRTFCLLPDSAEALESEESSETAGRRVLTRARIGKMLLLLLKHAAFRLNGDSPRDDDIDVSDERENQGPNQRTGQKNESILEQMSVDVAAASLLGVLPPKNDAVSGNGKLVKLGSLVDFVLKEASADGKDIPECLTFDSFSTWFYKSADAENNLPIDQRRVGPFLLELKLAASVLFGIPPSRASLESALVEEISRRHKYRYPQTEVSRRGPRGTVWYIIDDMWYRTWNNFVQKTRKPEEDEFDGRASYGGGSPRNLGKINNTGLLADNGSLALRPNIRWRQDYEIIPPLAWSALQAWYDGGPPIYRTVVPYVPREGGMKSPHSRSNDLRIRTEHEIELYPFFVTVFLCNAASRGEARPFQQYVPVSRVSPVRVLLVHLCKGLDVDPKYGRLWMMGSNPQERSTTGAAHEDGKLNDWLLNLDVNVVGQNSRSGETVAKHGESNSMVLLLELKDVETGKWPRGLDGRNWTFQKSSRLGDQQEEALTGDGVVGLYNMGNTCYLNSSIQCLSHTPVFRDYFTSKSYMNDINTTNPLGHQGRLAQVSAVLINSLWKRFNQSVVHQPKRVTAPGHYAPVTAPALTPKTFKDSLGKFNDHFAGNEQHDAQELLAFLLGGLSEDLNRIMDKPYIEAPDSDGRPDSELADIWWSNHLKREMSIIVALFTGQYKSLLTCRTCKYESARFEPFSFLQLPLPEDDKVSVSLILYPLKDGADTLKYSVRVRHNGRLLDVLIALAKVLHTESLIADKERDETAAEQTSKPVAEKEDDKTEDDTAKQLELENAYHRIAQNMAVVDMREGYIFKIAPNSWALPDLQNKDTGELPVLHIYELEPMIVREKSEMEKKAAVSGSDTNPQEHGMGEDDGETGDDQSEDSSDGSEHPAEGKAEPTKGSIRPEGEDSDSSDDVKYSFLALAQRMTEVVSRNQIHPFSHKVFGTPLLLRVIDLEGYSGRDLYDVVAKRIRNFVPKSALRFLVDESELTKDDHERGGSNSKQKGGTRQRRQRTTSEMEVVAAGPVTRYGFRLRLTSRDGRRCALCPWYECCIGCLIPDDDYPTIAVCGDSIVIDWHFAVDIATSGFGLRNQTEGTAVPAALRARTTSVTVKNHSSSDGAKKKGQAGAITLEDCLDSFAKEERIPEAYCSKCKDFRVQTKHMSLWRLPPVVIIHLKRFQFTQHMRRKLRDLVVFPVEGLDLSRIVAPDAKPGKDSDECVRINGHGIPGDEETAATDAETTDENEENYQVFPGMAPSSNNNGRSVMLYDLYAVVHHQGALSGGHYVASLKSELDGQWRLFNDAQVYEIHSRDVVDSSAYILFYIRRDVSKSKLQDFWDTTEREGEGLTEEEVEKLMKGRADRCVIS